MYSSFSISAFMTLTHIYTLHPNYYMTKNEVFTPVSSQGRWNIGTQNLKITSFFRIHRHSSYSRSTHYTVNMWVNSYSYSYSYLQLRRKKEIHNIFLDKLKSSVQNLGVACYFWSQTSWNRHWMQFVPPHKTSKRKKLSIVKTYGRLLK